jgi:hypothetical protein
VAPRRAVILPPRAARNFVTGTLRPGAQLLPNCTKKKKKASYNACCKSGFIMSQIFIETSKDNMPPEIPN